MGACLGTRRDGNGEGSAPSAAEAYAFLRLPLGLEYQVTISPTGLLQHAVPRSAPGGHPLQSSRIPMPSVVRPPPPYGAGLSAFRLPESTSSVLSVQGNGGGGTVELGPPKPQEITLAVEQPGHESAESGQDAAGCAAVPWQPSRGADRQLRLSQAVQQAVLNGEHGVPYHLVNAIVDGAQGWNLTEHSSYRWVYVNHNHFLTSAAPASWV